MHSSRKGSFALTCALVGLAVVLVDGKFYSETIARGHLLDDLFSNYNIDSRPESHKRIDVLTNLELNHFDFHEPDGACKFQGKLYVSWNDTKLRWSPQDYNNITTIYVSSKALWVPDLEIFNNAPEQFLRMRYSSLVRVDYEGRAMWVDNVRMTIFCSTDMRRWPFDRHECKLILGAWTYSGLEVDVVGADTNLTINFDESKMRNTEYRVTNYTAVHVVTIYSCCAEPYISINYILSIERRAGFAILFRMPAFCIIILTLTAFWLEPYRAEKLILHGLNLIIIVFNLIFFAKNHLKFTRNIPLIVIFYSVSFVFVTLALLLSVFVLSVTRSKLKSHLPPGFAKLLKSRLGAVLDPYSNVRISKCQNAEMHCQFEDVKLQEYSNLISLDASPDEWKRFAFVVERISFLVYCGIFCLLVTICLP